MHHESINTSWYGDCLVDGLKVVKSLIHTKLRVKICYSPLPCRCGRLCFMIQGPDPCLNSCRVLLCFMETSRNHLSSSLARDPTGIPIVQHSVIVWHLWWDTVQSNLDKLSNINIDVQWRCEWWHCIGSCLCAFCWRPLLCTLEASNFAVKKPMLNERLPLHENCWHLNRQNRQRWVIVRSCNKRQLCFQSCENRSQFKKLFCNLKYTLTIPNYMPNRRLLNSQLDCGLPRASCTIFQQILEDSRGMDSRQGFWVKDERDMKRERERREVSVIAINNYWVSIPAASTLMRVDSGIFV